MTVPTRDALAARDNTDPLAPLRGAFLLPDGLVYLDGNSLGPLPQSVVARMNAVLHRQWGEDLIRSWNINGWVDLPRHAGDKIAKLIGARAGEVVVCDSTSVNLFKLLAAALRMQRDRFRILTEAHGFPTDGYIAEGLISYINHFSRTACDVVYAPRDEIARAIDDTIAVVTLTHVDYRSGRMYDMDQVTTAAHGDGALILWDLSHSAGAVPVDLNGSRADFAVGCGYKYLNGGPGAPAFAFVAERHQATLEPPITGWMGHIAPFDFAPNYRPAADINRLLCGTPPVLAMAALDTALDVVLRADMADIRAKSVALCTLFEELIAANCADDGFEIVEVPTGSRGSHVSLRHESAYAIMQALIGEGVIGDMRPPDLMRFGFAPLYVRYVDVWDAVDRLARVMRSGAWRRPEFQARARVP